MKTLPAEPRSPGNEEIPSSAHWKKTNGSEISHQEDLELKNSCNLKVFILTFVSQTVKAVTQHICFQKACGYLLNNYETTGSFHN